MPHRLLLAVIVLGGASHGLPGHAADNPLVNRLAVARQVYAEAKAATIERLRLSIVKKIEEAQKKGDLDLKRVYQAAMRDVESGALPTEERLKAIVKKAQLELQQAKKALLAEYKVIECEYVKQGDDKSAVAIREESKAVAKEVDEWLGDVAAPLQPRVRAGQVVAEAQGIRFVYIPSGTFQMGSPQTEKGRFAGEQLVNVKLSQPFLISQTEVTQSQWKRVMGNEPWKGKAFVEEGEHFPASHITWELAKSFCERLTLVERDAGRLDGERGYVLPTEAQWEYACRAGTQTAYSFGDDEGSLSEFAWWGGHECGGNAQRREFGHEVATKQPNPWNLFDMHGNMWEWCADFSQGDLVGGTDPQGPVHGNGHVLRGGGWADCQRFLRSANRTDGGPAAGNWGIRIVRVVSK